MFLSLADLGQQLAPQQRGIGVPGFDAIDSAVIAVMAITGPLASSSSQNEAKRRELATALAQVNVAAKTFAPSLVALGWTAEPKAINDIGDAAVALTPPASSEGGKVAWASLDTGALSLSKMLTVAGTAVLARAAAEASAAAQRAKTAIANLTVKLPMTDEDWVKIDGVIDSVQKDVALIGRLPLGRDDAARYSTIGSQIQAEFDMKLESVSSGFMNAAEGVVRSTGAAPQQGRRGAAWVERNKWPIIGVSALLLVAFSLSGRN